MGHTVQRHMSKQSVTHLLMPSPLSNVVLRRYVSFYLLMPSPLSNVVLRRYASAVLSDQPMGTYMYVSATTQRKGYGLNTPGTIRPELSKGTDIDMHGNSSTQLGTNAN